MKIPLAVICNTVFGEIVYTIGANAVRPYTGAY
jgi:hypothetical protein